ncbi:Phosphatidylserine decarboxylase proenzyme [Gracilariopsis chorda]|uniref:phosphatidylserine decarboxylase n=1 Tax=Gracilariopsis chorda TaxID=448386 RepID=A0A2V3ITK1_9FLOR|nr:Phosphatidylserine decarboxylase proenzyme [Gracilariopsis chorda]|eukprot:PXF45445.1 Phosphatidylserine decarboxylase proenzyme [Gracilariopsis chorda]
MGLAAAHWQNGPNVSKDAKLLRTVPLNAIGIVAHYTASIPIPKPLRKHAYTSYCSVTGCDASEVDAQLEDFYSLADFFARRIRQDLRPIDRLADLITPCDGQVMAAGPVGAYGSIDVKGIKYRIRDLMGATEREPLAESSVAVADREESGSRLWYVVIHIGPEHSHRFVSPAKWTLRSRRYIEGYLLWMNSDVDGLYTQNERVAVLGGWDHGFFAMAAVGAAGRGSIVLDGDEEPFTPRLQPKLGQVTNKSYEELKILQPGDSVGHFRLGSAILVLFEAPEQGLQFEVKPGESVKLGERLVTIENSTVKKRVSHKQEVRVGNHRTSSPSRSTFRRTW